jgi:Protein of unknown function (DUF1552)
MIITKKALPRRTFLKGMGVTAALPFLDAMVPALTALPAGKDRLVFTFIPMGAVMAKWTPPGEGRLTALSPILDSLLPFRDQLTILTNLELAKAYGPTGADHAMSNSTFLSCAPAKVTEGSDYYLATTADQIAAKQMGRDTRLPSLELGTDLIAQVGHCDDGLACAYQNNLSWSSPTTPLPTEADPRTVFERLFGEGGTPGQRSADARRNRSILDAVTEDIKRLKMQVDRADQVQVSNYFDTVREVERRIQKAEEEGAQSPEVNPERPSSILPLLWGDHVKLMFDLQVLAFHAGHYLPVGARGQFAHVPRDRRAGCAPPDVPSPEQARADGKARQDQHVSHVALWVFPGEAAGDARRRRLVAGPRDLHVGQRHGQSGYPRSSEPAGAGGRRRERQAERRPAHPVRGADADGESAPHAARQGGRETRQLRRQRGQNPRVDGADQSVRKKGTELISATVATENIPVPISAGAE